MNNSHAPLRALLLCALISVGCREVYAAADYRCLEVGTSFSDKDAITEVAVSLGFQNDQLNAPWLFEALTVGLMHTDGTGKSRAVPRIKYEIENSRLVSFFCLSGSVVESDEMQFLIGPRKLKLLARRPSEVTLGRSKLEGMRVNMKEDTQLLTYGSMPPISLLLQPAPDWVVVTRKRMERTKDGQLRIELQLFNPTTIDQQGAEVRFTFSAPSFIECAGPTPRTPTQVQVSVEFSKGVAKVYTSEPALGTELIERRATILPESCEKNAAFLIEVGPTGQLSPGFNTVRYAFGSSLLVPSSVRLFMSKGMEQFRDVLRWPNVEAEIQGNVYPKRIDLGVH
jgi:hypothetical protein